MYSFPNLKPVCCSMSSSNCCFLTCIQISQEAGKVVCYSHLLKNFPQFVVIHTVKGFGVNNKAKVDVFLYSLAFSMIQQMLASCLVDIKLFVFLYLPWESRVLEAMPQYLLINSGKHYLNLLQWIFDMIGNQDLSATPLLLLFWTFSFLWPMFIAHVPCSKHCNKHWYEQ